MRPLMLPSSVLAVAVLAGGTAVVGLSYRSLERSAEGASGPVDARTATSATATSRADVPVIPLVFPRTPGPERAHAFVPSPAVLSALESVGASGRLPARGPLSPLSAPQEFDPTTWHEFYFARGIYQGGGGGGFFGRRRSSWATDFPEAEDHLITVLKRLTNLDVYENRRTHLPIDLADPNLHRYPFLYILEVGSMRMSTAQLENLRTYLDAGGFLMVDDFWGSGEWWNFEEEMARLFPERPIEKIETDHPLFNMVYNIERVEQVPGIGGGFGRRTYQGDGVVPEVRGIFDDERRLMVVINWNTDLGDAWEWADSPRYPLESSTYAFEVAVNQIVYAMTH